MSRFQPGDWITYLWGYEAEGDGECDVAAFVTSTSRHSKSNLTEDEARARVEAEHNGWRVTRPVTWWASTKEHREADFCECEEGGFCEEGRGKGAVTVLLCVSSQALETQQ